MGQTLGLRKSNVDANPFVQFGRWYSEVQAQIGEAQAVTLATASPAGQPSARMVLLKGYGSESGFIFYTNFGSRKAQELIANPWAAMLFYWPTLDRQIRIEGRVQRVPAALADAYFAGRHRGSQISAASSPQSRVVPNRETLEEWREEMEQELAGREVPRPDHWGGFALHPIRFEFWQGRDDRFHDRLQYRLRPDGSWLLERLAP